LAGDPEGSGYESEDDLMIIIDTEAEEQARVEEEIIEHQRIKEIKRDLEESSKKAGFFSLPPIASILPSRGKGRLGAVTTTPGGTSVPEGSSTPRNIPLPGGPFTPGSTFVPGHPFAPVGASAPRIHLSLGDTSVSEDSVSLKGASAPKIHSTPGGASAPGGLRTPGGTSVSQDSVVPKGFCAQE